MVVKRDKGTGTGLHFSEGRGDIKKGGLRKKAGMIDLYAPWIILNKIT